MLSLHLEHKYLDYFKLKGLISYHMFSADVLFDNVADVTGIKELNVVLMRGCQSSRQYF